MNKKGFIISTTLYSIFGIILIAIFYILYLLSTNRLVSMTSVDHIKREINSEKTKVYLNLLSEQYYLNNIKQADIDKLINELKANNIELVVDKSTLTNTVEKNNQKADKDKSVIAQPIYSVSYDLNNYFINGYQLSSGTYLNGNAQVIDDALILYTSVNDTKYGSNYGYSKIYVANINDLKNGIANPKIYVLSGSMANSQIAEVRYLENGTTYNKNMPELCVTYIQNSITKNAVLDPSSTSINFKSVGSCSSYHGKVDKYNDFSNEDTFSTYGYGGVFTNFEKSGSDYMLKISAPGYRNSLLTYNLVDYTSNFSMKFCGRYDLYVLQIGRTNLIYPKGETSSFPCSRDDGHESNTFSFDFNQHHLNTKDSPSIGYYDDIGANSYNPSAYNWRDLVTDIKNSAKACEGGNDICLNNVDSLLLPVTGDDFSRSLTRYKSRTVFNSQDGRTYEAYRIDIDEYPIIFKYGNRIGKLVNIRQRASVPYTKTLTTFGYDTFNFYILWQEKLTENDLNTIVPTFNYTNTNKIKNDIEFDKEFYAFDYPYDDSDTETYNITLTPELSAQINKSNSTSLVYLRSTYASTELIENVFPARNKEVISKYTASFSLSDIKKRILNEVKELNKQNESTTESETEKIKYTDSSGANPPKLVEGMIPVKYESGNWKSVNIYNDAWYDYDKKIWANAVTVTTSSRSKYINSDGSIKSNVTISVDDINSMWVWIPRFKYRIPFRAVGTYKTIYSSSGVFDSGVGGISKGQSGEIDVVFEKDKESSWHPNAIKNDATLQRNMSTLAIKEYYTHPAFDSGVISDFTGIWVGKFETGGTETEPLIKPNIYSLASQTLNQQINTAFLFSNGKGSKSEVSFSTNPNNIYGINVTSNLTDTHMMKNSEWGAVVYLAHSKYGVGNTEIYPNLPANRTKTITGKSSEYGLCGTYYDDYDLNVSDVLDSDGNCGTSSTSVTSYEYSTEKGVKASTTGNIYGVYDMSGGLGERVMGRVGSDSRLCFGTSSEYCDIYNSSTSSYSIEKYPEMFYLGDATYETLNWNKETYLETINVGKYILRSHISSNITSNIHGRTMVPAGVFAYGQTDDSANSYIGFRVTLRQR